MRRVDVRQDPVHLLSSIAVGASLRGHDSLSSREVICIGGPNVDHVVSELVTTVRAVLK